MTKTTATTLKEEEKDGNKKHMDPTKLPKQRTYQHTHSSAKTCWRVVRAKREGRNKYNSEEEQIFEEAMKNEWVIWSLQWRHPPTPKHATLLSPYNEHNEYRYLRRRQSLHQRRRTLAQNQAPKLTRGMMTTKCTFSFASSVRFSHAKNRRYTYIHSNTLSHTRTRAPRQTVRRTLWSFGDLWLPLHYHVFLFCFPCFLFSCALGILLLVMLLSVRISLSLLFCLALLSS